MTKPAEKELAALSDEQRSHLADIMLVSDGCGCEDCLLNKARDVERIIGARDAALIAEALAPFEALAASYEKANGDNLSCAKYWEREGRFDLFNAYMQIAGSCSSFADELRAALSQVLKATDREGGSRG